MDVSTRRRGPMGLVGMGLMVLVAELSLARRADDYAVSYAHEWRTTGRAARLQAKGCDVLCFGDSLAKCGLALPVFEGMTGLRAYNLAMSAGQAPACYFALRRAIDAGSRPKAILVDFKWAPLMVDPILDRYLLPELVGPRDCVDLAWAARDGWLLGLLLTEDLLPSARLRNGLRTVALEALKGLPNDRRQVAALYRRNWRMNRGSLLLGPEAPPDVDPIDPTLAQPDWACHPVHAAYVDRFLDLAAAHGIHVYWMLTPIRPELQAARAANGSDAAYSGFVRDVQRRYRYVTILDGRGSGFGRDLFVDRTHLNRRGAVAWTADVASRVRADAGDEGLTGRWVDMPRYRDPLGLPALEDLGDSRVALAREAEGRRR